MRSIPQRTQAVAIPDIEPHGVNQIIRAFSMPLKQKITPCLWFDGEAEEAARFYPGFSRWITTFTPQDKP
jgi:hypothetical protein